MGERLTKRDIEKIEEEIEHRKLVIRKEAIEAVKEARAQGDLSENFEYYAAKKHKNQNESRIRYLERMLKTATVVDDSSKSDEVGMDDIVEVEFEEDGEVEKYKLVTSIRGNSMEIVSASNLRSERLLKDTESETVYWSRSMKMSAIICASNQSTRPEMKAKTSAASKK